MSLAEPLARHPAALCIPTMLRDAPIQSWLSKTSGVQAALDQHHGCHGLALSAKPITLWLQAVMAIAALSRLTRI